LKCICNFAGGLGLTAVGEVVVSILDNGTATVPVAMFAITRDSFIVVCSIAWKSTDASLDDPVESVLAVLVLGSLRLEEQGAWLIFLLRRDSRLTTKHGVVAVLGGDCAIAWKATDASMDDTVVGLGLGDTLAVLVGRILLHREERR